LNFILLKNNNLKSFHLYIAIKIQLCLKPIRVSATVIE
jgi:hypothetical protein